jgi:hypothetical protein
VPTSWGASLLASILGGRASLILREGREGGGGGLWGCLGTRKEGVEDEVAELNWRLSSSMERGPVGLGDAWGGEGGLRGRLVLEQVHSPSQTGHISPSSSSSGDNAGAPFTVWE